MPESTAFFSVEAVGQMYHQTNEFVYLGAGSINYSYNGDLSHHGRPTWFTQCIVVQLPEVHPRTVRPTKRPPRAQNMDAKSRCTRDKAVRLRHVKSVRVPLRHATPSPPSRPDSLYRLAKENSNQLLYTQL